MKDEAERNIIVKGRGRGSAVDVDANHAEGAKKAKLANQKNAMRRPVANGEFEVTAGEFGEIQHAAVEMESNEGIGAAEGKMRTKNSLTAHGMTREKEKQDSVATAEYSQEAGAGQAVKNVRNSLSTLSERLRAVQEARMGEGQAGGQLVDPGKDLRWKTREESDIQRVGSGASLVKSPSWPDVVKKKERAGVGMVVEMRGSKVIVSQVMPDGEAVRQGVCEGDELIAVGGRSTYGLEIRQVRFTAPIFSYTVDHLPFLVHLVALFLSLSILLALAAHDILSGIKSLRTKGENS